MSEAKPQSKDPIRSSLFQARKGIFTMNGGIPPPPRSSRIIDLAEILEIIYGAQQLTGKIFIRKELAPADEFSRIPLSPWLVWAC